MTTTTIEGSSARDRLLAAADELFYAEGVHAVGIDRVIERAGVAKASLYNVFGSKDELVKAYLERRSAVIQARITQGLQQYKTPAREADRDLRTPGQVLSQPGFRGCAFIRASSESPRSGGPVDTAAAEHRGWIRSLFLELADQVGVASTDRTGQAAVTGQRRRVHCRMDGWRSHCGCHRSDYRHHARQRGIGLTAGGRPQ